MFFVYYSVRQIHPLQSFLFVLIQSLFKTQRGLNSVVWNYLEIHRVSQRHERVHPGVVFPSISIKSLS